MAKARREVLADGVVASVMAERMGIAEARAQMVPWGAGHQAVGPAAVQAAVPAVGIDHPVGSMEVAFQIGQAHYDTGPMVRILAVGAVVRRVAVGVRRQRPGVDLAEAARSVLHSQAMTTLVAKALATTAEDLAPTVPLELVQEMEQAQMEVEVVEVEVVEVEVVEVEVVEVEVVEVEVVEVVVAANIVAHQGIVPLQIHTLRRIILGPTHHPQTPPVTRFTFVLAQLLKTWSTLNCRLRWGRGNLLVVTTARIAYVIPLQSRGEDGLIMYRTFK